MITTKHKKTSPAKTLKKPLKKAVTKRTVLSVKKMTVKKEPAKVVVKKSVVRKAAPKAKAIHKATAPKSKVTTGVRLTTRIQTAEGRRRAVKRKSLSKA